MQFVVLIASGTKTIYVIGMVCFLRANGPIIDTASTNVIGEIAVFVHQLSHGAQFHSQTPKMVTLVFEVYS